MARRQPKRIGLAIVGAGRVGLFRGEVAARHPQVDWIGVADLKPDRAKLVADKCKADFVTQDFRALLARPEVTAAIISTDEHLHVEPILAAVERKLSLLIEKPLATELAASQRVLDATAGVITFEDGSLYHAVISWALPTVWPGAVYSLEVGITGTEGVITVDDTHRDIVLATTKESGEGYAPDKARRVDFLGSYPPGDMVLGELRGPMREETEQWLNRLSMGLTTQHATAAEAHNRLMLTKAFDKSARLKRPIPLPIDAE